MTIQVLGSGCPSCKKLYEAVGQAVAEMKLDTQVEYLTGTDGLQKIAELGAMSSPVLAIDDQVALTGLRTDVAGLKTIIARYVPQE